MGKSANNKSTSSSSSSSSNQGSKPRNVIQNSHVHQSHVQTNLPPSQTHKSPHNTNSQKNVINEIERTSYVAKRKNIKEDKDDIASGKKSKTETVKTGGKSVLELDKDMSDYWDANAKNKSESNVKAAKEKVKVNTEKVKVEEEVVSGDEE